MCGSRKYPSPPPTEDSLICTPTPQDFPFQGVFDNPPPPRNFQNFLNGEFAYHALES